MGVGRLRGRTLDRLVDLGAPSDRTVLVNWGVDLTGFAPAGAAERAALKSSLGLMRGRVILSTRSLTPPKVLTNRSAMSKRLAAAQLTA